MADRTSADPDGLLAESTVNPEFARRVDLVIADLQGQGFEVLVFEVDRSFERSDRLYCQGRPGNSRCAGLPTSGPIVTNAPGGSSWHNYGLAADLVPKNSNGGPSWPDNHPIWDAIGESAERHGLAWGGARDRPHIEFHPSLGTGFASATAQREIHARGGVEAVWEAVGAT